jgi:hypothetical protein
VQSVRIDVALIPDEPLFDMAVAASQAITDEFYYNANVVDAKKYPPHLSLHICPVPADALEAVGAAVVELATKGLPELRIAGVEPASGGYVMLNVERTAEIMAMHEAVLEIAARAREDLGGDPYGNTYIRDQFVPHISLAKVDRDDQKQAAEIGRQAVAGKSTSAQARALDLCDIGERSEKWDVIVSAQ